VESGIPNPSGCSRLSRAGLNDNEISHFGGKVVILQDSKSAVHPFQRFLDRIGFLFGSKRNAKLIFATVIGLFIIHSLSFYRMMVDDSYITFRYADNLARGFGAVFNPGERVEGYSNFTLVLLLVPFARAAVDLMAASKVIGFISGTIAVIFTIRLSSLYAGKDSLFRFVPAFLLAASASFALYSMAGIETDLYAMLLVAGTFYYIRWQRLAGGSLPNESGTKEKSETLGRWDPAISGILLSLAAMSRPEGALFGLALGIDALINVLYRRKLSSKDVTWAACLALPFMAYLGWRFWYYGMLLPNTYYAKTWGGMALKLKSFRYGYEFVMVNGGGLLIALIALAILAKGFKHYRPILLFLAANAFFVFNAGSDWMPMHRFFVPSLAMIFLLASEGIRILYDRFAAPAQDAMRANVVLLPKAIAGMLILGLAAFAYVEERHISGNPRAGWRHTGEFAIARWLIQNARPDETLAIDAAGIIPYLSRLYSIDYLGICDVHIARQPGLLHDKSDPEYVLSKRPDYVVMCGKEQHPTREQISRFDIPGMRKPEDDLMRHPRLRTGYEFAAAIEMENGAGIIWRRKK
jgi:arabinofuranosyltransferase